MFLLACYKYAIIVLMKGQEGNREIVLKTTAMLFLYRHDSSAKLAKKGKGHPPRGSPAWMSPELIDKGEISCKADVYSFAIILWEMLTRQLPYESSSVFQVLFM